ncbi:ABC transporter substrate-binding protein [Kineosporia sp. NBRC 101731]|uniref:ABC transporter substrate-binding protein n=1 Tax=Kineosporia sp. NBRC 101731 TaxID=3032199 RepID=UPI0024A4F609|nr:ABC transporter substrate-binding protein [Kineosporia sp. NBRC 101731]GLY29764.1 myristoyl transferase [Kineosporia sp. NBRC 101731]
MIFRTSNSAGRRGRRAAALTLAALVSGVLAACGSGSGTTTGADGGTTKITFALSYLPDPYLNGLAYAMQDGLLKDAGIEVELLPFGSTSSDSLVASGQAQFGNTVDVRSALLAQAKGMPLTSLMAVYQHTPYQLTVLDDGKVARPADLAGKTYGGFGSPFELAVVNQMIESDGGSGKADEVVLSAAAYQALSAGRVDTTLSYPGDLYAMKQAGTKISSFDTTDFGVPDAAATLLIGNNSFVKDNPEVTEKFVQAVQKGYEVALKDPEAANKALAAQFPGAVDDQVTSYISELQNKDFYPPAEGKFGNQSAQMWQANADWMAEKGLLVDDSGKPLKSLDVAGLFTNDYLG